MEEQGVCLADYCDILRCDIVIERIKRESLIFPTIKNDYEDTDYDGTIEKDSDGLLTRYYNKYYDSSSYRKCDSKKMKKLKSKCVIIMNQCLLGLLTTKIVQSLQLDLNDDNGDQNNMDIDQMDEINHKIISSICDLLSCDKSWKDFFLDVSISNSSFLILLTAPYFYSERADNVFAYA